MSAFDFREILSRSEELAEIPDGWAEGPPVLCGAEGDYQVALLYYQPVGDGVGEVRRLLLLSVPGGEVRCLSPREGAERFGMALRLPLRQVEDYDAYFRAVDRYEAAVDALCRRAAAGEPLSGGRAAGALLGQIVPEQAYREVYHPLGRALFDLPE